MTALLAALWPIIWHIGGAAATVAALLAFAWFSPVFKKTALWAASILAIGTAVYVVGVNNGKHYVQSKWDSQLAAEEKNGEDARRNAESALRSGTLTGVRDDKRNRDNR